MLSHLQPLHLNVGQPEEPWPDLSALMSPDLSTLALAFVLGGKELKVLGEGTHLEPIILPPLPQALVIHNSGIPI